MCQQSIDLFTRLSEFRVKVEPTAIRIARRTGENKGTLAPLNGSILNTVNKYNHGTRRGVLLRSPNSVIDFKDNTTGYYMPNIETIIVKREKI